MISWIQRTFQHHFRIIFAIVLAGTVISFITTIGSTPGVGRGERTSTSRLFFGHNLGSREEMGPLAEDARISLQLQSPDQEVDSDHFQMYFLQRTAALHLADTLHIPQPDEQAMAKSIRELPRFSGKDGSFDPSLYEAYTTEANKSGADAGSEIAKVIADDIRMEAVEKLIAGPGYALPGDIRERALLGDTTWSVAVADIPYSSFKPALYPSQSDLDKYFSQNSFRYQISPKIGVDAIVFDAAKFVSKVVVTDDEVRAAYDRDPSAYPAPKGLEKADASAVFAAVRSQVEKDLRAERARTQAGNAASDLAVAIYDAKVSRGPALNALLAARNLSVLPLAPFTHEDGPAEFGHAQDLSDAAFGLNADRYYSEALATKDGSVILLWREALPARTPALAEVAPKVRADYIESERRSRFVDLGASLKSSLQSSLARGATFARAAQVVAALNHIKINVITPSDFTLRAPAKDLDQAVLGTLGRLEKGRLSDMVSAADHGYIVDVLDKKVPALDPASPAYVSARTQLTMASARMGASSALSELVETELRRSETAKN